MISFVILIDSYSCTAVVRRTGWKPEVPDSGIFLCQCLGRQLGRNYWYLFLTTIFKECEIILNCLKYAAS